MKISIFGINNLEKSIFVRRILEFLKLESQNYSIIKEIQNNYFEDSFYHDEKYFTITNLPHSDLFRKKKNKKRSFDEDITRINNEKISESDYVVLIFNFDHLALDYFSQITEFIEKNSKNSFFVYFDYFDRNLSEIKFSFKNKKIYSIPFYPLAKSKDQIGYFLKKEFSISNDAECKKDQNFLIKSVIIGPPNSGKSSFLNSIIGHKRSLVSDIEGTTKEEINSFFVYKKWLFEIFDTEGLLKKETVYSINSIKSSDIVFMVIDITKFITKNVLQIADTVQRRKSLLFIVLNKIDLVSRGEAKEKEDTLRFRLKSFSFIPIVSLSATKRINFKSLFEKVENIIAESKISVSKRMITSYSKYLVEKNQPPLIRGKRLKFYYGFHEKGFVHKIIFFVNDPECVHFSYQRYILNSFRRKVNIKYLPIKIFFKKS